jgi:hypothetical protein
MACVALRPPRIGVDAGQRVRYGQRVSQKTGRCAVADRGAVRARRWLAPAAALIALLGAAPAAAEDARQLMDDVWKRFRSPGSEKEAMEILVIAAPQEGFYTRAQLAPLLDDPPADVKHKRAVRRAVYGVEGVDKIHVLFSLPAEDAGLGLLIFAGVDKPADRMWLYMPGYRSVRQIPASNTQRFADTDLFYEDVRAQVGDRTASYEYETGGTADCGGRTCQVIEATPREEVTTSYGKRTFWIDSEWRFPVRVELRARNGKLWKTLQSSEIREVAPGVRRAGLVEMRDLERQSATVLLSSEREVGGQIPPQVFTQDFLQHPDTP